MKKMLVGLLVVALAAVVAVGQVHAAKPKSGNWFSDQVDPDDSDNLSSVQFKVNGKGKKLTKITIYWRCGNKDGYHNFTNPPIPIGINKKKKFKLVGATTPPAGQSTKDFTLKGKFTSSKQARFSMELDKCGPKTKGKLQHAG